MRRRLMSPGTTADEQKSLLVAIFHAISERLLERNTLAWAIFKLVHLRRGGPNHGLNIRFTSGKINLLTGLHANLN